jgi:hypothetical protein
MWGKADELRLSVLMGLRNGLGLIRGMRRSLTDDEQHKVADAIVEHLEKNNWKIEQARTGTRRTWPAPDVQMKAAIPGGLLNCIACCRLVPASSKIV